MRRYLGKILAGEIRRPGSFEPRTVEVLATLTPRIAKLFLAFCNISVDLSDRSVVIAAPFGPPGENSLRKFGLDYAALTALHDAGLIQTDLNAWFERSCCE